jgi:hypothetical protein
VAAVPAAHPRADPARVVISLRAQEEFARGRLRAREGNRSRDEVARA